MNRPDIDGGKSFDWGKTSSDYALYRDIYPEILYERLLALGIGTKGQHILDTGTGTGVIPRNMYRFGGKFTGTDISENQIAAAKMLAEKAGMDITFEVCPSEELNFPNGSFDVITACQCYFYFDHAVTAPLFADILKDGGKLAFIYMGWLPYEDNIAGGSEKLVLKFNPNWTGKGDMRHEIFVPKAYDGFFIKESSEVFDVRIPFTRESWNGRIKACRGIGASLSQKEISAFDKEHTELLEKIAPESFEIRHYCAVTVLKRI